MDQASISPGLLDRSTRPRNIPFLLHKTRKLRPVLLESHDAKVVIIDEVQKVPELLDVVHSLIEEKLGYQFILTGSSARKLKKAGVNLLVGRALLKHMPPFFAKELGSSFQLDRNLRLGMLPVVLDSPLTKEVLKAYAGIYLKEEVQEEGIVRNVGDFSRFLEIMSFSHASLLNVSNIARECQIARKTVDGYLLILHDLLLSFHLDVFRRRSKRLLSSHSKFYFFDVGVYNSLRPQSLFDKEQEHYALSLEGLVAQHLKNWKEAQTDNGQLHFWRTASQLEVDFIITAPSCFLALEVKHGEVVHPADLRGLEAFGEDYPEAQLILLYRGKRKYKERNVLCYPVEEFLLKIDPREPLPGIGPCEQGPG